MRQQLAITAISEAGPDSKRMQDVADQSWFCDVCGRLYVGQPVVVHHIVGEPSVVCSGCSTRRCEDCE